MMRSEASGYWGIGRNDTGVAQVAPNVIWHPGDVLFHPKFDFTGSGGRFVATWVAPSNMTINADWAYQVRATGSDGVGLGVLHESGGSNTVLRNFANPEGATGTFSNLNVLAGDKLHFRFDNWPTAVGDITWADITVNKVSATPPSGIIFSENFNGYVGNQNTTQFETGLELAVNGNVSGWLNSGAGTMHAVDQNNLGGQSNPSDWAIMLWQDNVITSKTIADSNFLGQEYVLTFDYGTGVYAGTSQETGPLDDILVEVLRGNNTVLTSMVFDPGAWGAGNRNLEAGLQGLVKYIGDGTGNIHLRFGPNGPLNSGHFEGSIDNVVLQAVPEPASIALWSLLGIGLVTFTCYRKKFTC
jgi:hypothetical protein